MLTQSDVEKTLDLLEIVYSVKCREDLFPLLSGGIDRLFHSSSAIFYLYNPRDDLLEYNGHYIHNISPTLYRQFVMYYISMVPPKFIDWFRNPHSTFVANPEDFSDPEMRKKSELIQDFYPQIPMRYSLAIKLARQGDFLGSLTIHRQRKEGPFGSREMILSEILAPNIAKVLHQFVFLGQTDLSSQSEVGILVVEDPENRILYANTAAARILEEGAPSPLPLPGSGRLPTLFWTPTKTYRLRSFSLSSSFPEFLSRRLQTRATLQKKTSVRVVHLEPLSETRTLRHRMVEEGLSLRQQDVVALLMEGHSNREISERLRITEPTVRDHIHSIFEKIGFKNRSELTAHFSIKPYLNFPLSRTNRLRFDRTSIIGQCDFYERK